MTVNNIQIVCALASYLNLLVKIKKGDSYIVYD